MYRLISIQALSVCLEGTFSVGLAHMITIFTLNIYITKTYLYNFDPLKPHFYIVKLRFTGVYIIFLISAQIVDCGYSLEPPQRVGSNEYQQSMFWAEIWKKNIRIFVWKLSVFGSEMFNIFE